MTMEERAAAATQAEYTDDEVDALAEESEREEIERNLAAREGRFLAARSEAELAVSLLELEWRVVQSGDVGEALELRDQVTAVSSYLRSSRRSLGLQKQSEVVKLRAERRAGELLLGLERGRGIRVDLREPGLDESEPFPIGSEYGRVLRETGLGERRARRLQEVANVSDAVYDAFVPSLEEMRERVAELAEDHAGEVTERLERQDFSTAALLRVARASEPDDGGTGHRWDETLTPPSILRRAKELLRGIELDPSADAGCSVGAERTLGVAEDGLSVRWGARSVLLHPPFSVVAEFVEKWAQERAAGRTGETLLVLPAPLEDHLWQAPWWRLVAEQPFCLIGERFRGERLPYPLTMVSYGGERQDDFRATFNALGPVLRS